MRLRAPRFVWLLLPVLFGAACPRERREPPGENPLLTTPRPEIPATSQAASDPDALVALVKAPHRHTAAGLGAHRFEGKQSLSVTEAGKEVESLDETFRLEVTATGTLHALYENSADYGREAYFDGQTFWVRPRYGKFVKRPPTRPDEPAAFADDVYGALGAALDLVGFSTAVTDEGAATEAGRPARTLRLATGQTRRRPAETGDRAWRNDVTVNQVSGTLVVDEETGAVLRGTIRAEVSFVKKGRSFDMRLEVKHTLTDVGGDVVVTLPTEEQTTTLPERSREVEERDSLLEGLAPPLRQRGTGSP